MADVGYSSTYVQNGGGYNYYEPMCYGFNMTRLLPQFNETEEEFGVSSTSFSPYNPQFIFYGLYGLVNGVKRTFLGKSLDSFLEIRFSKPARIFAFSMHGFLTANYYSKTGRMFYVNSMYAHWVSYVDENNDIVVRKLTILLFLLI